MELSHKQYLLLKKIVIQFEYEHNYSQSKNPELYKVVAGSKIIAISTENKNLTNGKEYEVINNDWLNHPRVFTIRDDRGKLYKVRRSSTRFIIARRKNDK